MYKLFTILILLVSFNAFSKGNFEKGYIIKTNDTKIECFIENEYWSYNPVEIKYKTDSTINIAGLNEIKAFEIYNYAKFEKHVVARSESWEKIEKNALFQWKKDTVFLQVIIEGDPSLYSYRKGVDPVYFCQTHENPEPLELRKRLSEENGELTKNYTYKNQLSDLAKNCTDLSDQISKLDYGVDAMAKIVEKINMCNHKPYKIYNYRNMSAKIFTNLYLDAGLISNNFLIEKRGNAQFDFSSKSKTGFVFGLSFEFQSAVYFKNWSLVAQSYYQNFKESRSLSDYFDVQTNVSGINLGLGIRRYLNRKDNFKIFVEGVISSDLLGFNNKVEYYSVYPVSRQRYLEYSLDAKAILYPALGAGFKYKRLGLSCRYNFPHRFLTGVDNEVWKSKLSSFQATASFRIL